MRHVAVIGSGPAGYYTAEACVKLFGDRVRVDIVDRLPVPYGLIRSGVAPDHQSIKAVSRRFEATALGETVRFVGNVTVGTDVSVAELRSLYDAVVVATGAPADRPLGVAGDDLPGVVGSAAFVGWYNGHPDFADLAPVLDGPDVVVVGAGNVALDVARILAKTGDEFTGSDIAAHAFDALGKHGAESASVYVTHGVLSGGAVARISSSLIETMVLTDSIQATEAVRVSHNIRQLTIAPLLAQAMQRISDESSVSSLFE